VFTFFLILSSIHVFLFLIPTEDLSLQDCSYFFLYYKRVKFQLVAEVQRGERGQGVRKNLSLQEISVPEKATDRRGYRTSEYFF